MNSKSSKFCYRRYLRNFIKAGGERLSFNLSLRYKLLPKLNIARLEEFVCSGFFGMNFVVLMECDFILLFIF
jgi:hypothetical protein